MGSRSKTYIFLLVIGVLAITSFFVIQNNYFEKKEIKYNQQESPYSFSKENSVGLWAFRRLLMKDGYKVSFYNRIDEIPKNQDSTTILLFKNYWHLESGQTDQLNALMNQSNDLFLFVKNTSLWNDYNQIRTDKKVKYHSIEYHSKKEAYTFNTNSLTEDKSLAARNFYWNDTISKDDFISFDTLILADYYSHAKTKNSSNLNLTCTSVNAPLMEIVYLKDNKIYLHHSPELLTNISTKSKGYFSHYQEVISHMKNKHILFITAHEGDHMANSSLKYILKNKSFRWAYYLSLITALTYMIFGGKRRQKAIRIFERKKNTTISYVKTLSKLYQKNSSNKAVILKIEENFYKYVSNKYQLRRNDDDFWGKLANNINVYKTELDPLNTAIELLERQKQEHSRYKFTKDDINKLYNLLESFYKKSEKWTK